MSGLFFGMPATSSREPVLITSRPVADGSDDELMMVLRANITSMGWHLFFWLQLITVFKGDSERRKSWLTLSVLLGNTIVAPLAT